MPRPAIVDAHLSCGFVSRASLIRFLCLSGLIAAVSSAAFGREAKQATPGTLAIEANGVVRLFEYAHYDLRESNARTDAQRATLT